MGRSLTVPSPLSPLASKLSALNSPLSAPNSQLSLSALNFRLRTALS
jgi:hypothetical protein